MFSLHSFNSFLCKKLDKVLSYDFFSFCNCFFLACMKIIFLIMPQCRALVRISLREMCWNHCETLALFTSWHSVSVLMLETVYIPGFNKYVNQVHISLGMQMSLMRKDKLQNKQTKAEKMLNSLCKSGDRKEVDWRFWDVILAILGLFNQPILKLWQINCFFAGRELGKDGSQAEFSHKMAWKSLGLLFVAI